MALGSNRDAYVTSERKIKNNLRRHAERMAELIAEGMSREDASRAAYEEMTTKRRATERKTQGR